MSKTKAELEAETARLREENEALLGLLAAIWAAAKVPQAIWEDREQANDLAHTRLIQIKSHAGSVVQGEYSADICAKVLTDNLEKPAYRLYVEPEPVLEGTVTGRPQDAPYAGVIRTAPDAGNGMPGPLCPASHPTGGCRRLDGHPMPHRTMDGCEWGAVCGAVLHGSQDITCALPLLHGGDYHIRATGEVTYRWPNEFAGEAVGSRM